MDFVQQNERLEQRKADLRDGFDAGYDFGYKAAMGQVYKDIKAIIKKTGDAETFKGLLKKTGAAVTKKAAKPSSIVFTMAKQQFIRDEGL